MEEKREEEGLTTAWGEGKNQATMLLDEERREGERESAKVRKIFLNSLILSSHLSHPSMVLYTK